MIAAVDHSSEIVALLVATARQSRTEYGSIRLELPELHLAVQAPTSDRAQTLLSEELHTEFRVLRREMVPILAIQAIQRKKREHRSNRAYCAQADELINRLQEQIPT